MAAYAGRQNFVPVAQTETFFEIKASATTRARLCEVLVSSDAAPSENMGEYRIRRTTVPGTTPAGSTTIVKLDSFSPAAGCTFAGDYAGLPTYGDSMMDFSVHQNKVFRWIAYPGKEMATAPATDAGIALEVGQFVPAFFSVNVSCTWLE